MVKNESEGYYAIGMVGIGVSFIGSIITFLKEGLNNILFGIMIFGFFAFVIITIIISFYSEQKSNTEKIQNLEENINIQKELNSIKSDVSYLRGMIENGKK